MNWLLPLLQMFYAPTRGMSRVRDGGALGRAALVALLTYSLYELCLQWPQASASPLTLGVIFVNAIVPLLCITLAFVPITIFVANLFERRGSFSHALQQEYAPLAATMFYALAAASLAAVPLALWSSLSGFEASAMRAAERAQKLNAQLPRDGSQPDPQLIAQMLPLLGIMFLAVALSPLPFFALWSIVAVHEVFGFSWWRALLVVVISGVLFVPTMFVLIWLFSHVGILSSPFMLLLLFFFLRGYFGEIMRTQRARATFRQNLEAATLNPADASAHYNLGLIHLQRKELAEARGRFRRALEIDEDEVDAHYQLGRISRMEGKLPEAIEHFGQVVTRAPQHAQHEVWREIGATYLAASQFSDALDALERFLEQRPSDPEGLYLKGRALAGLGRQREAAEAMRACIEAVETAPAYKYRADKRWLNEAQQFLRTQA
jgi:tetratricopeptide (TPR) repeat protein